jgi:hypothetical protein
LPPDGPEEADDILRQPLRRFFSGHLLPPRLRAAVWHH